MPGLTADHRNGLYLERSPPMKEESAARLLTEHPGCLWVGRLLCHSGSVKSPLTRKRGWPDYRGRPESRAAALWDSGSTWGTDWEPQQPGAGRQSDRSRSLAKSCTRSGWASKRACRGLKIPTKTGKYIRFKSHWRAQESTNVNIYNVKKTFRQPETTATIFKALKVTMESLICQVQKKSAEHLKMLIIFFLLDKRPGCSFHASEASTTAFFSHLVRRFLLNKNETTAGRVLRDVFLNPCLKSKSILPNVPFGFVNNSCCICF